MDNFLHISTHHLSRLTGMIWILLMVWACEKPKPYPPITPPSNNTDSNWVWRQNLTQGNLVQGSHHPFFHNGIVVYSSSGLVAGENLLLAFNGATGNVEWRWSDYIEPPIYLNRGNKNISNGKFVYKSNHEIGAIDLSNGNTTWNFVDPNRSLRPRVNLVDDQAYFSFHKNYGTPNEMVYLIKSPVSKLELDTVTGVPIKNGYRPSIEGPSLWINPSGDSVLLFQNRTFKSSTNNGYVQKVFLHAYNLAEDTTEFILPDITPMGGSNVISPIVHNDECYFLGERSVLGINLLSQEIEWTIRFEDEGGHFVWSNMLLVNGKIIVHQDNGNIHAIDPISGQMVWSTSDAGATPTYMREMNGVIYYTSDADGKLYGVNAQNGQILLTIEPPFEDDFFMNGVAVNPAEGLIYAMDHRYAYCFDPHSFK